VDPEVVDLANWVAVGIDERAEDDVAGRVDVDIEATDFGQEFIQDADVANRHLLHHRLAGLAGETSTRQARVANRAARTPRMVLSSCVESLSVSVGRRGPVSSIADASQPTGAVSPPLSTLPT